MSVSDAARLTVDGALSILERATRADVRAEAVYGLCEAAFAGPAADWPTYEGAVVRCLSDRQDEVRCAGLALASVVLTPIEAKELFSRHLADAVPRVRLEAVGRLADLALPEARGALASALEDSVLAVRFEAARGMVELEHPAGFEVLVEALGDVELRFRAASALARRGNKEAVGPLKRAFEGWFVPAFDKTQIAGALAVFGDADGVAYLFKRAAARWWAVDRPMAVELLGEVRAPGALAVLLGIVRNPKDVARGSAARALGRLGDVAAEGPLSELLLAADATDDFKLDVCEGLLMLETPSARAQVEALQLTEASAVQELALLLNESAVPTTPRLHETH